MAQPFDSPSHVAQLKWDGVRCIARVAGGIVRLCSRSLRDRTDRYPELSGLPHLVAATEATLDGELVALRQGLPSFFAIMQRELAAPAAVPRLARSQAAVFMVFDLVDLDGQDLVGEPLVARQAALARILRPDEAVQLVESFPGSRGQALYQAVVARGLEGVVLKESSSRYVTGGSKSGHWLKVKAVRRLQAVVGGLSGRSGLPGALLLGLYAGGALRYIGRAGSGLADRDLEQLRRELPPAPCPFSPPPALGALPVTWVPPHLVAVVDFAEWTPDLHLRQPVVVGFAAIDPGACEFP